VKIYRGEALRHAFLNCVFNCSYLSYVEATSQGGRNSVPHLEVNTKLEVWQFVRCLLTLHVCHTVLIWVTTEYINQNYVNVTFSNLQKCYNPFSTFLTILTREKRSTHKEWLWQWKTKYTQTSLVVTLCTTNPSKTGDKIHENRISRRNFPATNKGKLTLPRPVC
jgi:hypothetical protein